MKSLHHVVEVEDDPDHYDFFYHIAGEMPLLAGADDSQKSSLAREAIINHIEDDKTSFTKVFLYKENIFSFN